MLYTQDTRFIKIDTPLGKDVLLLESFNGSEAISNLFSFGLEFLSEDPSINYDDIVGQNVTLIIRLMDDTERYFNGFISKFSQGSSDTHFTYYNAEMVPWLWFLTLTSDCRIFQNKTVPEIIEKIFSDLGFSDFKNELKGSFKKRVFCVQYRETDFNFVSRLMEEEGIFYFFKHENGKHTLVLGNSTNVHIPCPEQKQARYHSAGDAFLEEDTVTGLEMQKEVRPGKYALTDYNFEMPSTSLAANVSGDGEYEIYDYPGEYNQKADGDSLVRIRLEEEETPILVVGGSSNCRAFTTGFTFGLFDHYRDDMNSSYLLMSISHSASETSYSRGGSSGNGQLAYSNSFTCIPGNVPFRPARITRKPIVQGPQTAVVVGRPGEEILVDEYGRVKVQFHWDREGKKDQNSSCWIRVSQNWAGKKWGGMFIPRIGQEVIVDFLEGDPDQPIITGRVYNAEQVVPYELPKEQTKSTIKSDSSKGHSGFNELRYEDKKGEEQVFLHAQKDMDHRVLNDSREWIGNDRHLIIKANQKELVEKDKHLKVKGNRNEEVDKVISIKAGQKIIIEAGTEISLKASGNFIDIGPAGIYINGKMVFINSGGSTGSPTEPEDPDVADDGTKTDKLN